MSRDAVVLRFRNFYRCNHEDSLEEGKPPAEWQDEWDSMCNDRCPVCNHEIEPHESEDLIPDTVDA